MEWKESRGSSSWILWYAWVKSEAVSIAEVQTRGKEEKARGRGEDLTSCRIYCNNLQGSEKGDAFCLSKVKCDGL